MEPKPVVLAMVRFAAPPWDMTALIQPGNPLGVPVYEPLPFPHVRVGTRRFPWHTVIEFQVATDKAAEARARKVPK